MAADGERRNAGTIRERLGDLDPRVRFDREAVGDRLDAFYVRYFVPPSVTEQEVRTDEPASATGDEEDDDDYEGFDATGWLQEGRDSGPKRPPAEARVVTEPTEVEAGTSTVDHDGFDCTGWLDEDAASESLAANVADAQTGEPTGNDHDGFAFVDWLAEDEAYEPIEVDEPAPDEPTVEEAAVVGDSLDAEPRATGPTVAEPTVEPVAGPQSGGLHPAKAAMFALFLAVATLTVLSIVGYLPPLGPEAGL
jgi:hypothetical protein